jgi:hypothetical protein
VGDTTIYCSDSLYARVSGSGDIDYKGNPTKKDVKVSGSELFQKCKLASTPLVLF